MVCMTKRLVWAVGVLYKPERRVDSDIKSRELLWQARELPMVTRRHWEWEGGESVWARLMKETDLCNL